MHDDEALGELPGYGHMTQATLTLAQEAATLSPGKLAEAYLFTREHYMGGGVGSSQSSVRFLVIEEPGAALLQDPDFCAMLHRNLLAALGRLA